MTPNALARWFAKIEKSPSGCWEWAGAKINGYGVMQRGARGDGVERAHRFAYRTFVGPIPDDLDVRHSCHNRACVNPWHLSTGTRAENMGDSARDGRLKRHAVGGSAHARAKLSEAQVAAILRDDRILREIAADYGMSISGIWRIRQRKGWKHVATPRP